MNMKSVYLILVFGVVGCGGAPASDDSSGADGTTGQAPNAMDEAPVVDANANNSTLPSVASLYLANGNTIDFYDGGKEGILITELGKAYTTPALKGIDVRALGAVKTWNSLSPAAPAPRALVELQERVDAHAQAAGSAAAVGRPIDHPTDRGGSSEASMLTPRQGASVPEGNSAVQAAVNACNNGCCDHDWLAFHLCPLQGDYDWFAFDVGWSWVQNYDIARVNEIVCAATGTSRFGVHRGDFITTFNVSEGFYQSYNWFEGVCLFGCGSDNHSVVNANSNNQPVSPTNMHTFCGAALHE